MCVVDGRARKRSRTTHPRERKTISRRGPTRLIRRVRLVVRQTTEIENRACWAALYSRRARPSQANSDTMSAA